MAASKTKLLFLVVFGVASFLALGSTAWAADFSVDDRSGDNYGPVDVVMTGEVVQGDTEKLKAVLSPIDAKRGGMPYDDTVKLFLDSPGGNYVEGLKLSGFVREKGIATRVKAGAGCFSACALVFMHGTAKTPDDEEYLDRKMEVGAAVGFHAPYLTVMKDAEFKSGETPILIETAYAEALKQFSILLESGSRILSTELLIKMLRTAPDNMTMVSTWGDLLTWKITLDKPPVLARLTYDQMKMGCLNAWGSGAGQASGYLFRRAGGRLQLYEAETVQEAPQGS
jgi:hypothetical protein